MAVTNGTLWEIRDTATTGNVNGAGFNTAATFGITDATTDANTANTSAPVISSATYNFVASDVNAWLYVKSGTNWTAGFYQISSVASNKATINATIGSAIQLNTTTNRYGASTVVGCATVGTPTNGTIGVDYSQQDTADVNGVTDFASVGASTTLTSVTAPFKLTHIGNIFHLTTTGTGGFGVVGWYEITTYTSTSQVTTDRTTNNGTALVNGTGYVGGAGRLNGLEDAFLEQAPAGSKIFIKKGTYTLSATVSIVSTLSTEPTPTFIMGYTSLRGDACNGSDRPTIAIAANTWILGQYQNGENLNFTQTGSSAVAHGNGSTLYNCKALNSSTTASRPGFSLGASDSKIINCEAISQNGTAISWNSVTRGKIHGCYMHDSSSGLKGTCQGGSITGSIFEANSTEAIFNDRSVGGSLYANNTCYGREGKIGNGMTIGVGDAPNTIINNIFYGLAIGFSQATTLSESNFVKFNNYFNNTADTALAYKDGTDLAIDPQFSGATQITGTTGSGSGSTITDTNADFSTVTDNVDFVRQISGTGATVATFLITSHTATTLVCNNTVGTNATADRVYYVTTGHNFGVGNSALKNAGFPNFTNIGSDTTGYPTVGAVQAQSGTGSSGMLYIPNLDGI